MRANVNEIRLSALLFDERLIASLVTRELGAQLYLVTEGAANAKRVGFDLRTERRT
jgi:hypothetical protein